MATIIEYLDAARARARFPTDAALSLAIDQHRGWAHFIRAGKALPSDESMVRLAELAGIDPARALLDLNLWKARDPSVSRVYTSLLQRIAVGAGIFALVIGSSYSVQARSNTEQRAANSLSAVYYQKWRRYPWGQLLSALRLHRIYLLPA